MASLPAQLSGRGEQGVRDEGLGAGVASHHLDAVGGPGSAMKRRDRVDDAELGMVQGVHAHDVRGAAQRADLAVPRAVQPPGGEGVAGAGGAVVVCCCLVVFVMLCCLLLFSLCCLLFKGEVL